MKFFQLLVFVIFVSFTRPSSTQKPSPRSSAKDEFCCTIESKGTDLTFCNITEKWSQRISTGGLKAITSVLSVVSAVTALYTIFKVAPTVHSNFMSVMHTRSCDMCCYPCFVVLPVARLLWDAVDVMLDAYTFQQLERGKLIDSCIYRNKHILHAILAFTVIGVLKMFLNMWILLKASKYFQLSSKDDIANLKRATVLITFLFEDAIELLLEYFWIERFFTSSPPFYLLGRDILLGIFGSIPVILDILDARKKENSKYQRILYGILALIGVLSLVRVFAVIDQCVQLKINSDCFNISNGRIYQAPFHSNCLKKVDYVIIILLIMSLVSSFYVFLIPSKILMRKDFETPLKNEPNA